MCVVRLVDSEETHMRSILRGLWRSGIGGNEDLAGRHGEALSLLRKQQSARSPAGTVDRIGEYLRDRQAASP